MYIHYRKKSKKNSHKRNLLKKFVTRHKFVKKQWQLKLGEADLTIVVGDPHSNNTARLSQISIERANTPSYRIASLEDLDLNWLKER